MKARFYLLTLMSFLFLLNSCTKSTTPPLINTGTQTQTSTLNTAGFRVIGYLPNTADNVFDGSQVNYQTVSHLNLAFVNPDTGGNFAAQTGISSIVTAAHAANVKVLISIGGGAAPTYYSDLLTDSKRAKFISNLMALVTQYSLDGIDVDLEGDRIDANYEKFVVDLSAALKPASKLMTAAIATGYKDQYTDNALAQFDYVNIMSYDLTGPWDPSNPGPHSPYYMAVDDLTYWGVTRSIAKSRMNLGVPFYGYGFGGSAPSSISFHDIVAAYPGSENTDSVSASGGKIYYNGIPTIKAKTILAMSKAGGIMMWQLMQDATGSKSLLNTVNFTADSLTKK